MPSGRDIYTSKWLKADDLSDDEETFTIKGSGVNTFKEQDGREKQQLVLTFRETEKEFGLNVTNYRVLHDIFQSDETEDWQGNKVVLFITETSMTDGRTVPCLRVKRKATEKLFQERKASARRPAPDQQKGAALIKTKPVTQAEADQDGDEDIPF